MFIHQLDSIQDAEYSQQIAEFKQKIANLEFKVDFDIKLKTNH